jgi:DNA-binding IclR family transcriptional regulator
MAKLTEAQVLDMRNQREAGASLSTLAKAFGITPSGVHLIVTRKKWAHV